MAYIKPFKALRYDSKNAGDIKELCCPPYDIISEEQRLKFIDTNEHNVIRLELPKGETPYENAKEILNSWLEKEVLVRDMDEAIYVYRLGFKSEVTEGQEMSVSGIICRVRVEEFKNGVVLPHEETLSKAKTDRLNLMKATSCNFSQIYSLYIDEDHKSLERTTNVMNSQEPRYNFSDGLVNHSLWVINDKELINELCDDFKDRKLYIADGHHRYETAINYKNYVKENGIHSPGSEYVMMMLSDMGDPGLVVFPTHRLIRDLKDFNSNELLQKCEEYFIVEDFSDVLSCEKELKKLYNEGKKAFCFYDNDGICKILTLKDIEVMKDILPNTSESYKNLDVNVLHCLILERLLGIDKENMANQVNLTYTRSFEEAVDSVKTGKSNCTFIMNPTRVSEIGDVAAAGEKMPQKSTYFYPKLITGLVMNQLNP